MRILFLFLDGVGLGEDNPAANPFAAANLPTLRELTGGRPWLRSTERVETGRSVFVPTDARLGVDGRPQSATGQAAILTGINVPRTLGYHYGPKPNADIAAMIRRDNLVLQLHARGLSVALLNAYPPRFFTGIENGKHLLSANQLAFHSAGVGLLGAEHLYRGKALSADFTGEGWRTHLGYTDTPLITPFEAGQTLARLGQQVDFAFFDHWVTDFIGHRGTLEEGIRHLELIDRVMAGLLDAWDDSQGLIILTSDHGNIEDRDAHGHTLNPVPTVVIGERRHELADGLASLIDLAPRILRIMPGDSQGIDQPHPPAPVDPAP